MWRVIIILLWGCFFQSLRAHTVDSVFLSFQETGELWRVEILLDASLAVPELRDDDKAPQPTREWLYERSGDEYRLMRLEAEAFLRGIVSFTHADRAVEYTLGFPDFTSEPYEFPRLLNGGAYLTIEIMGKLSAAEGEFIIHAAEGNGPDIIVGLSEGDETSYLTLQPGDSEGLFSTTSSGVEAVGKRGAYSLLELGYRHVIPEGLDHILFILCLFLMARQWKLLLRQSLVFTGAHSLTLGLAVSGAIQIQQWPAAVIGMIEPLIALSILALAVENILRKEGMRGRYLMVFTFGLIHGLGFAGSLGATLQPGGDWLYPLALANLGVELAQVSVLIAAWVLTLPLVRSSRYKWFEKSCSIFIAGIAGWMFFERVLG